MTCLGDQHVHSDSKTTRCLATLGWSRLPKSGTSLCLQQEETYLWSVKPESWEGASGSHELVGGPRQRCVPKFLPLLEPGSHIGHLQTLCIHLCCQSRAPALQNTTRKPSCRLCRMGIFWHWIPWEVDRWETWASKQQEKASMNSSSIPDPYRLWVCQESDFLCVQLWSWRWDAQDAPHLGQRDGKWDHHPVVLATQRRIDMRSTLLSGPFLSVSVNECLL